MTVGSVAWADVVGQTRAAEILRSALAADELGHAWIVIGTPEIGQRELAVALAAALNCEDGDGTDACGSCRSCRRLLHETRTAAGTQSGHTVLREFYPEGAHHLVSAVREQWLPAASRTLAEGRRRVIRIAQADRMNEAAQNAFLKALEEPPASTLWLLEAEDDQDMLETILSRCRRLDLTAWRPVDLRRRGGQLGLPTDDEALLRAANGSPLRLRDFTQHECPACGRIYWPDPDGVIRVVVDARTRERAPTTVCVERCCHCPSCHTPVSIPQRARSRGPKYPCSACGYELAAVAKGQEEAHPVTLLRDLARTRHVETVRTLADVGPAAVTGTARAVIAWARACAGALEARQAEEITHLVEDHGVDSERDLPGGIRTPLRARHRREQRQAQQAAVERFLDDLGTYLRDVLVISAAGERSALVNVDRLPHLEVDAAQLPAEAAIRGLEDIARCRQALDEFNGQPELQLERVLMPLAVALYRRR